ncbi:MAG: small basic family protein [Clostridia bacterium]|nr:small basic family protein [Clostridia bacterium]
MIPILGLLIGCLTAFWIPWNINPAYSVYVAIAILAALDSVLGGVSANLNKRFSMIIFLSGFFGNALLAAFIIFLGEKLGLDLYVAVVVVFGTRLFQNFAIIRLHYVDKLDKRSKQLSIDEITPNPEA